MAGRYPIASGEAELLRDLDHADGWVLSVDGVPQSYVDLGDPTHLDFEYARHMGDVVDSLPEGPLDVLHVGGGAFTLPRYVAATRPGSRQIVIEPDGELVDLVRAQLRLREVPRLRVHVRDGRSGVVRLREDAFDVVMLDAFTGADIPGELTTAEFTRDVERVLRPGGTYILNMADGRPLTFARRVVATVSEVFPHALLLGEPGVLRGRRFGNIIVAASKAPLPVAGVTRRAANSPMRARCVHDEELDRFRGQARPLRDGDEVPSPAPPPAVFGLKDR
ncbi:spermidine synthase [Bailinhaonella thermotolerans]|uniref:Spermidine synthase-like protein n=1 Tax=Bailinhaonella thermotolerans TaxID=1070861 RepID=A0A3A3ZYN4_9ACTN|nr:fused MFS/spermidine synthase [Bailinhaonella thermotolerans]RJL20545.1 spermidine synthase-like protein [Bailinhaonella thermotolerans]